MSHCAVAQRARPPDRCHNLAPWSPPWSTGYAEDGHIEMSPTTICSGEAEHPDYEVISWARGRRRVDRHGTSLAPKAISEYGAHNQRSHITMNEYGGYRGSHQIAEQPCICLKREDVRDRACLRESEVRRGSRSRRRRSSDPRVRATRQVGLGQSIAYARTKSTGRLPGAGIEPTEDRHDVC